MFCCFFADGRKSGKAGRGDGSEAPGEPVDMMSRFREPGADITGTGLHCALRLRLGWDHVLVSPVASVRPCPMSW